MEYLAGLLGIIVAYLLYERRSLIASKTRLMVEARKVEKGQELVEELENDIETRKEPEWTTEVEQMTDEQIEDVLNT